MEEPEGVEEHPHEDSDGHGGFPVSSSPTPLGYGVSRPYCETSTKTVHGGLIHAQTHPSSSPLLVHDDPGGHGGFQARPSSQTLGYGVPRPTSEASTKSVHGDVIHDQYPSSSSLDLQSQTAQALAAYHVLPWAVQKELAAILANVHASGLAGTSKIHLQAAGIIPIFHQSDPMKKSPSKGQTRSNRLQTNFSASSETSVTLHAPSNAATLHIQSDLVSQPSSLNVSSITDPQIGLPGTKPIPATTFPAGGLPAGAGAAVVAAGELQPPPTKPPAATISNANPNLQNPNPNPNTSFYQTTLNEIPNPQPLISNPNPQSQTLHSQIPNSQSPTLNSQIPNFNSQIPNPQIETLISQSSHAPQIDIPNLSNSNPSSQLESLNLQINTPKCPIPNPSPQLGTLNPQIETSHPIENPNPQSNAYPNQLNFQLAIQNAKVDNPISQIDFPKLAGSKIGNHSKLLPKLNYP